MENYSPQPQEVQLEKLLEQIEQLKERYGLQVLQSRLQEVTSLTQDLNSALDKLENSELPSEQSQMSESSEQLHGELFQELHKISQLSANYYRKLAELPEDIRDFLITSGVTNSNQIENLFHPQTAAVVLQTIHADSSESILKRLLPVLQVTRPKSYVMPVDAISNRLSQLQDFNRVNVSGRRKNTVYTAVTLDAPTHMQIDGNLKLTTYDKSIINGVASLLESGNSSFTIPMLYHAMTGKENPSLEPTLVEELSSRLDMMRRLMITIDLTEEVREHLIRQAPQDADGIESFTIEGALLPLNKYTGIIHGQKSELYQVIDTPPLQSYAKMKNQIATVPISLLKAPLNNNSTTIPLKNYLITRIEGMKNPNNHLKQNRILFDSIYRELGALERDKKVKKRIRDYTEIILTHFISEKYIQHYELIKEGRTIRAVEIYWQSPSIISEQPQQA